MTILQQKQRDSNIELLRIVAMMLVLVVHSTFTANGFPNLSDVKNDPLGSCYFTIIGSLCFVCVNCYVLISGYFGIRPTLSKLAKLLFIVYFYRFSILLLCKYVLHDDITAIDFVKSLTPFYGEWFIGAYLGLFILSPIINGFIDNASKKSMGRMTAIYLLCMLLLGWVIPGSFSPTMNFANGYSVFSLIGLYIIGRYIRLHCDVTKYSKMRLLGTYMASSAINAVIYICLTFVLTTVFLFDTLKTWFCSYDSIFTITGAVCLLILFTKIKLQSRFVNWLAAASFSVYIIHCNPHIFHYFLKGARLIKALYWPWGWLPMVCLYCAAVYLAIACIDQIRIAIYNALTKALSPRKD